MTYYNRLRSQILKGQYNALVEAHTQWSYYRAWGQEVWEEFCAEYKSLQNRVARVKRAIERHDPRNKLLEELLPSLKGYLTHTFSSDRNL